MEKEIIINNELSEITHITNFVMGGLSHLFPDTILSISLALEEVIANVITHAYPLGEKHEISLKVNVAGKEILFLLTNDGERFNPVPIDEQEPIGINTQSPLSKMGIRLVHQIMDEVSYQYVDGQNQLMMKKKIGTNLQNPKLMKIDIHEIEGVTIITLEGRLDTVNAQKFEAIIRALEINKKPEIVVNCENLTYVSSSGIRCFILLQKNVTLRMGSLTLEGMKPEINKIFDMTGCALIFTIK